MRNRGWFKWRKRKQGTPCHKKEQTLPDRVHIGDISGKRRVEKILAARGYGTEVKKESQISSLRVTFPPTKTPPIRKKIGEAVCFSRWLVGLREKAQEV